MKEQEDIDQLFKSAFDDFEVAPPPAVKESIDLAIAGKSKSFPFWIVAVFALVAAAVIAGIFMLNSGEKTQLAAKTQQENTENAVSAQTPSGEANSGKTRGTDQNSANTAVKNVPAQPANSSTENPAGKKSGNAGKSTAQNTGVASGSVKERPAGNQTASGTSSNQKVRAASRSKQSRRTKKEQRSQTGSTKQNTLNPLSAGSESKTTSNAGDPAESNGSEGPVKNEEPKQEARQASKTEEAPKSAQAAAKDTLTPYAEEDTTAVPPKNKQREKPVLLLSVKPGTTFGFNQREDTSSIAIKERSAFFIQAEAAYAFTSRLAVTSGLSYEGWKEDYSRTGTVTDTVITGYYYDYIIDSTGITDSILVPIYGVENTTVELRNSYKLYNIGIPVFFTYSQSLSQKLILDLSAGAILGLQGSRTVSKTFSMGSGTVNKFGMKTCLRAQLRYQFSSWGVSLNTNFGYDLFPVHSWEQLDRTSRTFLNVGAGVHYQIGK